VPIVKGKKFPYTPKGIAAAEALSKTKSKKRG